MSFGTVIFIVCCICGYIRGRRILRETHEGKLPGASKDKEDHTYYFLGDL